MNLDPDKLKRSFHSAGSMQFDEGPEFDRRLRLARLSVGETLAGPLNWADVRYYNNEPVVSLGTFATWAASVDWELPDELRALAAGMPKDVLPDQLAALTDPPTGANPPAAAEGAAISWEEAVARVGNAIYGNAWIRRLSPHEALLVVRHVPYRLRYRHSSPSAALVSRDLAPGLREEVTRAADRHDECEAQWQATWKTIKDHIARGRLIAWIELGRDLQPFRPEWIARLARFGRTRAPTLYPHGTTRAPEQPYDVLSAAPGEAPIDRRADCVQVPVADYPGEGGVIWFDPPGVLGRDGEMYLHGEGFVIDAAQFDKLYPALVAATAPNEPAMSSSAGAPISNTGAAGPPTDHQPEKLEKSTASLADIKEAIEAHGRASEEELWEAVRAAYPGKNIPRALLRQATREVFGTRPPGRPKRCE
ncbi:MAG: hypothetical protein ACREE4_01220 [Stellaceae bacterium]